MSMPELIFDNENRFVDITSEDVRIRYADTEEIGDHTFKHVKYGIFAAEPAFEISHADMQDLLMHYRDVLFLVERKNKPKNKNNTIYKVIFAYSQSCSQHLGKLNFVNRRLSKNDPELKKYYDSDEVLDFLEFGYSDDSLPENRAALEPVYEQLILPHERRPWIKLNDYIGTEVEEGIYYFATSGESIGDRYLNNLPVVNINSGFNDEYVAAICHGTDFHPSFDIAVEYLAVGKEHFPRLKELHKLLGNGFYHEFGFTDSKANDDENVFEIPVLNEVFADIEKYEESAVIEDEKIPDEAEELVKGLGFRDLTVCFERPFFESSGFHEYNIAYKLGNRLVLGSKNNGKVVYEYHDLRFLSGLYVYKITRLKSGIDYPVIHKVIDCKEERLKQLLTPEAYELYVGEVEA